MAGWYFINVDKKQSAEITKLYAEKRKGFGSIRVLVTLGECSWNTSIFPDAKSGVYLLPLKAAVRKKEGITGGDRVTCTVTILR